MAARPQLVESPPPKAAIDRRNGKHDHETAATSTNDGNIRVLIGQEKNSTGSAAEPEEYLYNDGEGEESSVTDPSRDLLAKQQCTGLRSLILGNVEDVEKAENDKLKWMEKCNEYRKMIDDERRQARHTVTSYQTQISDLGKENDELTDYKERYLQLIQDLQLEDGECKACKALKSLLEKARTDVKRAQAEAKRWEKEANCWKIEYEAVLRHCGSAD